jgi:MFS family permease
VSPNIEHLIGITTIEVADVCGVFFIIYGLMQIPNGLILDQYGIRVLPYFITATLLGTVTFLLFKNEISLVIGRLFIGLGCSVAFTAAIYMATRIFTLKKIPFFVAFVSVAASTGAILATRLLKFTLDRMSYGIIQLVIIAIVFMLVITSAILARLYHSKAPNPSLPSSLTLMKKLQEVFKQRNLIAIFIYTFFTWFIMLSFAGYWAKDYLMAVHHYSENYALDIMQLYWIFYLLASLSIAYFMKNIERCVTTIKYLVSMSAVLFLLFIIPIVFNKIAIVLFAIFAGISTAGISIGFSIITLIVPKDMVGITVATNNTFLVLGGLCGQVLFGSVIANVAQTPLASLAIIPTNYYYALLLLPSSAICALLSLFIGLKNPKRLYHHSDNKIH